MSAWATWIDSVQRFLKDHVRRWGESCCVDALSRGFIRKVYGILGAQMVVTTIIASHSPRLVALQVDVPRLVEDSLLQHVDPLFCLKGPGDPSPRVWKICLHETLTSARLSSKPCHAVTSVPMALRTGLITIYGEHLATALDEFFGLSCKSIDTMDKGEIQSRLGDLPDGRLHGRILLNGSAT